MDLIKLQQRAILIPTPGQPEQEYLAKYLMNRGVFFSIPQSDFSLNEVLQRSASFPFSNFPPIKQDQYKEVIEEFSLRL